MVASIISILSNVLHLNIYLFGIMFDMKLWFEFFLLNSQVHCRKNYTSSCTWSSVFWFWRKS